MRYTYVTAVQMAALRSQLQRMSRLWVVLRRPRACRRPRLRGQRPLHYEAPLKSPVGECMAEPPWVLASFHFFN